MFETLKDLDDEQKFKILFGLALDCVTDWRDSVSAGGINESIMHNMFAQSCVTKMRYEYWLCV